MQYVVLCEVEKRLTIITWGILYIIWMELPYALDKTLTKKHWMKSFHQYSISPQNTCPCRLTTVKIKAYNQRRAYCFGRNTDKAKAESISQS